MSYYRTDLATIHDSGFDQLARAAGQTLLAELRRRNLRKGTVIDIGCGSGITANILSNTGYTVVGVDLSEAHIQIARKKLPHAEFRIGSFIDMEVPNCIAVCAIGEVLNYSFDNRSDNAARQWFFARVFCGLVPDGVLLFDVAGPERAPERPMRNFVEGDDWAVLVETSAAGDELIRRIVTFRRVGLSYRRDSEEHRLHLISRNMIATELQSIGFGV